MSGTWPTSRGNGDRQPAPRLGIAGEDGRNRRRSGLAGDPRQQIAAQCRAAQARANGRPLTTTRTAGVPVATTRLEQLLLAAMQAEPMAVAELPGRRVVGQARPLAERRRSQRRHRARAATAVGEVLVAAVAQTRAPGMDDSLAAEPRSIADRIVVLPVSSSTGWMTSLDREAERVARWRISASVSI